MSYRYTLIDNSTGDIVDMSDFKITKVKNTDKNFDKLTKEDMFHFKNSDDDDSEKRIKSIKDYLNRYLRASGQIMHGQRIKIDGAWINDGVFKLAGDYGFEKEMLRLMSHTSSNFNTIKNKPTNENGNIHAKNWTDLYKFLKVNSRKQKKFREFLLEHNIVRMYTRTIENLETKSVMYVNPMYYRKYSHVGTKAIVAFKDFTLSDIHKYSRYYLYITEEIDEEDLSKYE